MAEEKPEYKSEEIGKNFSLFQKYSPCDEVMKVVHATTTKDLTNIAQSIFKSKSTLVTAGVKG